MKKIYYTIYKITNITNNHIYIGQHKTTDLYGENNFFFGKKHTDETKQHLKKLRKDTQKGENNHFYGKKHSEETKKLISEKKSGENNPNYGKTWINNLLENKLIKKEELDFWLKSGWFKGMLKQK